MAPNSTTCFPASIFSGSVQYFYTAAAPHRLNLKDLNTLSSSGVTQLRMTREGKSGVAPELLRNVFSWLTAMRAKMKGESSGVSRTPILPLKNPQTETDFKVNELVETMGALATKSDIEDLASRVTKLDSTITGMKLGLGIRSEEYTSAWMAQHISETKKIMVYSDVFKNAVISAPKGQYLFMNKRGKEVNSIELDCYSVEPVHAIGEFKAVFSPTDSESKDMLLEKVDLFVRKVKYLKDREEKETLPLAFFCVGELDYDMVDEILEILKEVNGVLVANVHKRNQYVRVT